MLLISIPPPLIVMVCPMNTAVTWWWDYFSKNKHYILLARRQSQTEWIMLSDNLTAWKPHHLTIILLVIPSRKELHRSYTSTVLYGSLNQEVALGQAGGKTRITYRILIGISSTRTAFTKRRSGRVQRTSSCPRARQEIIGGSAVTARH